MSSEVVSHKWKPYIGLGGTLFVYLIILVLIKKYLPHPKELLVLIESFYQTVGYPIVLLAGLAESIFPIGLYLPGSTVVLLGAALSRSGVVSFPIIMLLAIIAFMTGYTINYFVGKHGLNKTLKNIGFEHGLAEAEEKLQTYGWKAILLGYISPTTASFLSLAAGTLRFPFRKFFFFSLLSQIWWTLFWGTIAYTLGYLFVEFFLKYIFLIGMGVILIYGGRIWWKTKT